MTIMTKVENHSRPYRCGWFDARYGPIECFTGNRRLAEWDTASSRLDYYRGHRAGRRARQRSSDCLEAS
jgi:hypothetical protein